MSVDWLWTLATCGWLQLWEHPVLPGCEVVLSGGWQLAGVRHAMLLHGCSHLISTPLSLQTDVWWLCRLISTTADPHLNLWMISKLAEVLKLQVMMYVRNMKIISLNHPVTLREEVNWLCYASDVLMQNFTMLLSQLSQSTPTISMITGYDSKCYSSLKVKIFTYVNTCACISCLFFMWNMYIYSYFSWAAQRCEGCWLCSENKSIQAEILSWAESLGLSPSHCSPCSPCRKVWDVRLGVTPCSLPGVQG